MLILSCSHCCKPFNILLRRSQHFWCVFHFPAKSTMSVYSSPPTVASSYNQISFLPFVPALLTCLFFLFFFPASNSVYAQLEWALTVWLPGKPTQLRSYWPNFSPGDHKNDKRNNWLGEKNEDSAHTSVADWLSFSGYCGKLLQMWKSWRYFPGKGLPQLNAVVTFFFCQMHFLGSREICWQPPAHTSQIL